MKKLIIFLITIIFVSSFIYCILDKKEEVVKGDSEIRAAFISYIDYSILNGKSINEKKDIINEMINVIKSFNLNTIILQVRPFSDAIYKSNIFASSKVVVKHEGDNLDLDILDYFIKNN